MVDLLQLPTRPTTALDPNLNQPVNVENEVEIPNLHSQVTRVARFIANDALRHALEKILGGSRISA
jgi:hypothetical protein